MKTSKLADALNHIDEDLVAEAVTYTPEENAAEKGTVRISEVRRKEITMKKKGRKTKRTFAVAALTAVLVLGTMTVAVAAFRGSLTEGLRQMFHISEEQEEDILNRQDGLVQIIETEAQTPVDETEAVVDSSAAEETWEIGLVMAEGDVTSATCNGITVTLTQAMVDNYYMVLSLRVEGLPEEDTESMSFTETKMQFIGEDKFGSMSGSLASYGEGIQEWVYSIRPRNQKDPVPGWFFGKQLEINLKDINVFVDNEVGSEDVLEGEWNLKWTVQGTEESTVFALNHELGNTGATVTTVDMTPISVEVRYNFPKETYQVEGGGTMHKEPPYLMGVIMKDGTVYTGLTSMHLSRYAGGSTEEYVITAKLKYILDANEIERLLFVNEGNALLGENGEILDHVYVVPLQK